MSASIDEAKRVLRVEAQSILDMIERLDQRFEEAMQMILACKGKVIVSGMGKSGQIARKIASTLSSTGTPALFLHPAESSHGDLGLISEQDVLIVISYGGNSAELQNLLNFVTRRGLPLIAMTAGRESVLAKSAHVVLDISVREEACPLGLAPTSSSTATLALGDALAMGVLNQKGFRKEDFAEFHPGGSLGRRLLTRVRDIMHVGLALPLVTPDEDMAKVLSIMTAKEVRGVTGVVDSSGELIGVITDGDIRRRLEKNKNPFTERAKDLMSKNPKTIDADEMAERALFVMQQFKIQTLFAIEKSGQLNRPVGLLHLQDLLEARIR